MDPQSTPEDPKDGQAGQSAETSAETKNTDTRDAVPYDRFRKVNEEKKALEAKLAEIAKADDDRRKAAEKAQRDADIEQGKFKEAHEKAETELNTLRPLAEKAAEYEKAFSDMLVARLERVPDHIKELLAAMKPLAALKWLDAHAEDLAPRVAPPTDAGKTGDRGAIQQVVTLPPTSW